MVAGDQAEQRGFTGAVGADYLPVFARVHRPAQAVNNRTIVVRNYAVVQHDERRFGVQRKTRCRCVGLRQRHAVKLFAMRELGNKRLLQQGLLFAGFAQHAVRQYPGILNERRDLVKTIEDQHQGDTFAVQRGQHPGELLARGDIKTVERLIKNKQVGIAH